MNWLQGFGGTICNLQLKDEYKGIYHTDSGYQFYPHKIQGEGFYISVFKKDGELKLSATSNSRQSDNPQDTHIVYHSENKDIPRGSCAEYYLAKPGNFILYPKSDLTFAIPKSIASFFSFFEKHFYIRQAGIFMGIQKGVDFLPSHDLALSNHIRKDLPVVKVDYDDAITYLRCETIKAQAEKTGWCLVQYEGFNLGWIKVLQNRINNYFPKEWRILKQS
jgi:NOL1/NOP2/fmu family ribosome biogenesis protein